MKIESVHSAYNKPTAKKVIKSKVENSLMAEKKASPSFKSWGEDGPDYPVRPGGGEDWCKPRIRTSPALMDSALALQTKLQSLKTHKLERARLVAPEKIRSAVNQTPKYARVFVP